MFNAIKALFGSNKKENVNDLKDGQSFSIYDLENAQSVIKVNLVVSDDANFHVSISNHSAVICRNKSEFSITRTKDIPLEITIHMSILPNILGFYGNIDANISNKNLLHSSKFFKLNASSAKVLFTTKVSMTEVKLHLSQNAEVSLEQSTKDAYQQVFADMNDVSTLNVKADIRGLKVELRDESCLDLTCAGSIGVKVIHDWNNKHTTVKE